MKKGNSPFETVDYLNAYEKTFLDGLKPWRNRLQSHMAGPANGIYWEVYYILEKRKAPVNKDDEFDPPAHLTPKQKLQLSWLYKLSQQMPGKRIGKKVYNDSLLVDLAVLSSRNFVGNEDHQAHPGFEVRWTTEADCIERDEWEREEGAEEIEVTADEIINFDEFGSSGNEQYLVRPPLWCLGCLVFLRLVKSLTMCYFLTCSASESTFGQRRADRVRLVGQPAGQSIRLARSSLLRTRNI